MKIAFSLLHYNNLEVTREAVTYLQGLNNINECEIIIVDNASPNGSGKEIEELYNAEENIHVILNSQNGGFAYGNNIGYKYAKELSCDVIVVMNNDIYIKDIKFIEKLSRCVNESDDEIIAPIIYGQEGNQNPFRVEKSSTKHLYKLFFYNWFISKLYCIPGINSIYAHSRDKKDKKRKKTTCSSIEEKKSSKIWAPHGACIIFTKKWVSKEKFAFLPLTFMYFEEDILAEYAHAQGYSIYYDEKLNVHHVEDASVTFSTKTSVMKRKFISKNMSNSIMKLIELRKNLLLNNTIELEE